MVMMGMHSLPTNWPANFCQVPVRIAFRNPEVAAGLELGSFVDFFGGEGVCFNCEWSRVFKSNKIKIKEHIDFSI